MPGSVVVGKTANMWSLFRKPEYFKNAAGYLLGPLGWAHPGATQVPPLPRDGRVRWVLWERAGGLKMALLEEVV